MKIHTIGIDLGKTSFHLAGLNERGEIIVRKRFTRAQLLRFTANRKVHVIGRKNDVPYPPPRRCRGISQ